MTQDEMRAKFEGWLAEYGDYSITIREMLWDSYQAATAESEKRIAELEERYRWKPIESFPKKGGHYWLYGEGFQWQDFWRECANGDAYWEECGDIEPSHWRESPENPEQALAAKGK